MLRFHQWSFVSGSVQFSKFISVTLVSVLLDKVPQFSNKSCEVIKWINRQNITISRNDSIPVDQFGSNSISLDGSCLYELSGGTFTKYDSFPGPTVIHLRASVERNAIKAPIYQRPYDKVLKARAGLWDDKREESSPKIVHLQPPNDNHFTAAIGLRSHSKCPVVLRSFDITLMAEKTEMETI